MARSRDGEGDAPAAVDLGVAAAARGDRRAAEALLAAMLPRVRNLVRYLVRGDRDVDDIAQRALMAIHRGLPSYRGEGSLSAWADRITAREAFAELRRRREEWRRTHPDGPAILEETQAETGDPDYLLRRRAVRLLEALPDEQREAIVLHHVAGLSLPEVAEATGVSFDTAKSRVRLGMAKLRAEVGDG